MLVKRILAKEMTYVGRRINLFWNGNQQILSFSARNFGFEIDVIRIKKIID